MDFLAKSSVSSAPASLQFCEIDISHLNTAPIIGFTWAWQVISEN
jgi:hypothetical protein